MATSSARLADTSVLLDGPERGPARAPGILLGHGAGSDCREALLAAVALGVAAQGHPTCRFNFPYRERGRRVPDRRPILETATCQVAAAFRAAATPPLESLVAGGKSMGGRIASHVVAAGRLDCRGLLFLGYPLHPPGKIERLRTPHLASIHIPMLFVSGTRDRLARLDLLEQSVGALGPQARLHLIPDGDHSLQVLKRTRRSQEDVWAEVVDVITTWLAHLPHGSDEQ